MMNELKSKRDHYENEFASLFNYKTNSSNFKY